MIDQLLLSFILAKYEIVYACNALDKTQRLEQCRDKGAVIDTSQMISYQSKVWSE